MLILDHLWIILALPLLGSAINGLFGKTWPKSAVNSIAIGSVSLAFVGASSVSGELERGHLAVVLAKPVSRASWVLGRALGVAALAPILVGALYGIAWDFWSKKL